MRQPFVQVEGSTVLPDLNAGRAFIQKDFYLSAGKHGMNWILFVTDYP